MVLLRVVNQPCFVMARTICTTETCEWPMSCASSVTDNSPRAANVNTTGYHRASIPEPYCAHTTAASSVKRSANRRSRLPIATTPIRS